MVMGVVGEVGGRGGFLEIILTHQIQIEVGSSVTGLCPLIIQGITVFVSGQHSKNFRVCCCAIVNSYRVVQI